MIPWKQLSPYLVVLTTGNPLCVDLRIKSARTKTCSRRCIVMTGEAMMSLALNNSNSILE